MEKTPQNATLTAIRGLRVGHWTHETARTGCTVVLCPPEGCVASGLFLGPSPGTREAVLLAPEKKIERIHGLVLTGGSAFGLAAADGVVRFLRAHHVGYATPAGPVPIVPAAVIYDLRVGDPDTWPDAEAGYRAAEQASDAPVPTGRVGAGTGATVGKYLEPVDGGLGSACVQMEGLRVATLAVVNPVGDVYTPEGHLVAGHGRPEHLARRLLGPESTTLVVVATEARLTKPEAYRLAVAAHAALGRVIRPSHTEWDGDAVFVLSTATRPPAPLALLQLLTQEAVCQAVVQAVR